jgi:hypothetical protein
MPVSNGKTEMIFHRFSRDKLLGIIPSESKRVPGLPAFIADFPYTGIELFYAFVNHISNY